MLCFKCHQIFILIFRSPNQGGGSTSVSSSTNTNVDTETGDLGTSSSSGIDFGSIASGGGIMPDPSSLLSGAKHD